MQERPRELYREHTPWPLWVQGIVLVALAGAALGPWIEDGLGSTAHLLNLALAAVVVLSIWGLLGGLTVVVDARSIRVGLGRGWPIRTRIPLDRIRAMTSISYRPLRDFGGWGVRGAADGRMWSARGDRAVRLELEDGRTVFIGSDDPEGLEARIRRAAGLAGVEIASAPPPGDAAAP